jgi:hypothetical protein
MMAIVGVRDRGSQTRRRLDDPFRLQYCGSDAKDAEALSSLARAFFYVGACSLLVSHWEVGSDSTVKLITEAVAELNADPKIGRAEALRRSMLSMLANATELRGASHVLCAVRIGWQRWSFALMK